MHGVAAVASRSGGLAEIVSDGATGFLVPPGDIDVLASRLESMLADRTAVESMGSRGHERALSLFSLDAFAGRFEAIYHEAILQPGSAR